MIQESRWPTITNKRAHTATQIHWLTPCIQVHGQGGKTSYVTSACIPQSCLRTLETRPLDYGMVERKGLFDHAIACMIMQSPDRSCWCIDSSKGTSVGSSSRPNNRVGQAEVLKGPCHVEVKQRYLKYTNQ